MIPIIMAGGSGTRLWPLSRTTFPKQFLSLYSESSLLQETISRLQGLEVETPLVICNEEHRFLVAEQLRQKRFSAEILLEPTGRNTAPAIALAALHSLRSHPNASPVLLVLAADHVINDNSAFQDAIRNLLPEVSSGAFGTFGIVPTEPATGYGYINIDGTRNNETLFSVKAFTEKPDFNTAQEYLSKGEYYWNSGMFMMRADRYLQVLQEFRPDIFHACVDAMQDVRVDQDFIRINEAAFTACPEESIDYAVMESLAHQESKQLVMAPLDAGWSDVGSWSAVWDIAEKDENRNAVLLEDGAEVVLSATYDCLISAKHRLVTTLGVDNLIIVDTPDALLVANKDKAQDVKNIVAEIKSVNRSECYHHREVYRPWGKYDSIDQGERYQVKRITVNPGGKLSVQMHHHRAEHWVVVSGTAKVTNGKETYLVTENESTYIPIGQIHCLENPGVIPLEMIEVQSGGYLGEDDIVRIKDNYGRA